MSKKIRQELTYEAPMADVVAMLADPAFREQVCDYQGVKSRTVTITGPDVVIDQVQATQGIPAFATKFVGGEVNIVQKEHWATPQSATIEVVIPGKPGHMNGTATITESGGVTTEVVELEIKVNIPLVGGKIEGLIGDLLLKALRAENKVGVRYLAG